MLDSAMLSTMVGNGRADRQIYTDPEIFNLEMDRIFARVWIYIGHASQVKGRGDFFTTRVANKHLVVTRNTDGKIHAFYNRCSHRGSRICDEKSGNRTRFVCPYHAWSFGADGRLIGLPHRSGYANSLKDRVDELGLEQVARLGEYRGFIFAKLTPGGQSLEAFLGKQVCEALDNFVDRAPDGELELASGKLVQTFRANWKLQIENSIDLIHPPVLHQNAIQVSNEFMKDVDDPRTAPVAIDVFRSNGLAYDVWDDVKQYALENGHCYMEGFLQKTAEELAPDEDARFGSDDQLQFSGQGDYKAALIRRHGKERAEQILEFNRHNTIIYPNLFINPRLQQLRILQPMAVDRTEQHCYVFGLKGAPPEALQTAVAFLTASNSPASVVTTDDHEIFERVQEGLASGELEWLDFSRGIGRERELPIGLEAVGTNELAMRNQLKAWARYMSEEVQ